MTIPTKITDHATQGSETLLSQFQNSPRLKALVELLLGGTQEQEALFFELLDERDPSVAVGIQLDIIGRIVNWLRDGRTDDAYRELIEIGIAINQTDGEAYNAADIVARIVGVPVRYRQRGRAHYSLEWIRSTPIGETTIRLLNDVVMERISPAGVSWELIEGIEDGGGPPFTLDDADAGLDQGQLCRRIDVL